MRSSDNLHTGIQNKDPWKSRWREKEWKSSASASFSGGERNHFFLSLGGKQFDDIAGVVGLDSPSDSRAWSSIDFDHDGLNDIAMVNANEPGFVLYRNGASEIFDTETIGNMLAVDLRGGLKGPESSTEWSNRDAIGTRVELELPDGTTLLREKRLGEGFASQNSSTLVIGVGQATTVSAVRITWPSGKTSTARDVAVGQRIELFENPADTVDGSGVVLHPYLHREATLAAANPAAVPEEGRSFVIDAAQERAGEAKLMLYSTMATWCESCKKHMPQLGVLHEAMGEELALFGLPMDDQDTPEMLRGYVDQHHPGYDLLVELSATEREAARAVLDALVRKDVLPSTIVTDARGRVLLAMAGPPSVSDLRALLPHGSHEQNSL